MQEYSPSSMRKFNSRILKIFSWLCMVVPCLLLFHPMHENISWDAKPTPQQDASLLVNTRITAETCFFFCAILGKLHFPLPTHLARGQLVSHKRYRPHPPPTTTTAKILHRLLPAGGLSTIPWSRAMQNAIGGDGKAIPAALDCCAGNGC